MWTYSWNTLCDDRATVIWWSASNFECLIRTNIEWWVGKWTDQWSRLRKSMPKLVNSHLGVDRRDVIYWWLDSLRKLVQELEDCSNQLLASTQPGEVARGLHHLVVGDKLLRTQWHRTSLLLGMFLELEVQIWVFQAVVRQMEFLDMLLNRSGFRRLSTSKKLLIHRWNRCSD